MARVETCTRDGTSRGRGKGASRVRQTRAADKQSGAKTEDVGSRTQRQRASRDSNTKHHLNEDEDDEDDVITPLYCPGAHRKSLCAVRRFFRPDRTAIFFIAGQTKR